jgi:plastocyanin
VVPYGAARNLRFWRSFRVSQSRSLLFFCVALGTSVHTAPSPATDLRGTLAGVDSLSPATRQNPPRFRGAYWEVPNGVLALSTQHASVEFDVGVVLTGPGIAEATQPVGVRVEGGRCRPGTVVVTPGTTLDINNTDIVTHELYAVAQGTDNRVLAAEATSPRTHRQMQFAQAGVYELRDVRQPSFRCWVIAGPGQGRVLLPNAAGAVAATGLADGDYTIKVYFEGVERATQTVLMRGRDAQIPITLGAAPAPAAAQGRR